MRFFRRANGSGCLALGFRRRRVVELLLSDPSDFEPERPLLFGVSGAVKGREAWLAA